MKILLWLDDYRNPFKDDWLNFSPIGKNCEVVWVKSYAEFVDWITINKTPDAICFDHDLGDDSLSGMDCAKWLVNYCMDTSFILPLYAIQSANPVGRENIDNLLKNFLKSQI